MRCYISVQKNVHWTQCCRWHCCSRSVVCVWPLCAELPRTCLSEEHSETENVGCFEDDGSCTALGRSGKAMFCNVWDDIYMNKHPLIWGTCGLCCFLVWIWLEGTAQIYTWLLSLHLTVLGIMSALYLCKPKDVTDVIRTCWNQYCNSPRNAMPFL